MARVTQEELEKPNLTSTPDEYPDPVEPKIPTASLDEMSKAELIDKISSLERLIRAVADKGQLQRYDANLTEGEERDKECSISVYNGKPIISWTKLIVNQVHKIQNVPHTFTHTTQVTYLDKTSEMLDYTILYRDKEMIKAFIVGEFEDKKNKKTILTVKTEKYGSFDIDSTFIN